MGGILGSPLGSPSTTGNANKIDGVNAQLPVANGKNTTNDKELKAN